MIRAAFCVYAQIFIKQSIKCSVSVKDMKREVQQNSTSLPKLCNPYFSVISGFLCSWTGESLLLTALEFLKEIPHLKQILGAEIALCYPRRKLLKQWQTLSVPYWYSFHKQVKKLASKIKPRAIFSPISSNRKRRLMFT